MGGDMTSQKDMISINQHIIIKDERTEIISKCITDYNENLCYFVAPDARNPIFSGYYLSDESNISGLFPYILRKGSIEWNVDRFEVTVGEFIQTHPIVIKKGINVVIGFPMAGGPGKLPVKEAFNAFVSLISIKYPVFGLTLASTKILYDSLCSLFEYYEEKQITPREQLDALISNKYVSKYAIMEILDYDEYHARRYLEMLGFYRDKETGLYKINEINKIKAISIIEHTCDDDI